MPPPRANRCTTVSLAIGRVQQVGNIAARVPFRLVGVAHSGPATLSERRAAPQRQSQFMLAALVMPPIFRRLLMVRLSLVAFGLAAAAPLAAQTTTAPSTVSRAQMTANAEAEFARVDANKDGQMSRTEIENYQRTSATARITARNKALFAELDADKNGQISAVEFAKAS